MSENIISSLHDGGNQMDSLEMERGDAECVRERETKRRGPRVVLGPGAVVTAKVWSSASLAACESVELGATFQRSRVHRQ